MSISQYAIGSLKTFRGREGIGYSCFLLKGKKKVAEVVEEASGGELNIYWLDNTKATVHSRKYDDTPYSYEGTQEEADFYAEIMKMPKIPATEQYSEMFMSAHIFIDELVNEVLLEKNVKKTLKSYLTIKPKEGKLISYKINEKQPIEKLRLYVKTKHSDALVVNDLPLEEVIKIFKENDGI